MTNYCEGSLKNFSLRDKSGMEFNLSELEDAKILRIGVHPLAQEGGFSIDYEKSGEKKRLVLGYTELGTWIEWHGTIGKLNPTDQLKEKLERHSEKDFDLITKMQDDPLRLRIRFLDKEDKELFNLRLSEIKLLPYLSQVFRNPDRTLDEVINAMSIAAVTL